MKNPSEIKKVSLELKDMDTNIEKAEPAQLVKVLLGRKKAIVRFERVQILQKC